MNTATWILWLSLNADPQVQFYLATDMYRCNEPLVAYVCDNIALNPEAPQRYRHVCDLMLYDAVTWRTGDLADIGRDMGHSGHRLDQVNGGSGTQEVQRQIIRKLDKLIDDMENPQKPGDPSTPSTPRPSNPGTDPPAIPGAGQLGDRELKRLYDEWGKLPEKERQRITQELTRDLPPKWKPMIDEYLKGLNKPCKNY